ncbi:MAG: AmmeMemoRadiSam system protein A [Candidatus Omnitrophica bacterium]|nr:AmmeMemoRadiSam system protein A [Candidatus Omnitrophota bacterium]MCM8793900.1 AmmeMemoRadiSam system protein A [Candidatus Omnitrophota bacterium]
MLRQEQKKKLLSLARETLESYLKTGKIPPFFTDEPQLLEKRGAFVTLKKAGELRGCIGRIFSEIPLYQTIQEMAIEAGLDDPRFSPVSLKELPEVKIEISVLSELKKIGDIEEIEVGKHGILIRRGFYSGLLLPQVAVEYHWTKEEFLIHTCFKAGLPPLIWKDKNTQIYIFTAEVFSEEGLNK